MPRPRRDDEDPYDEEQDQETQTPEGQSSITYDSNRELQRRTQPQDYFPPGYQFPSEERQTPTQTPTPAIADQTPVAPSAAPISNGGDRQGVINYVTQELAKYGVKPSGRGTGPGDVEYWADRILQEGGLNSGYDWAGRIQRGATNTQPPLGTPGASFAPSTDRAMASAGGPGAGGGFSFTSPSGNRSNIFSGGPFTDPNSKALFDLMMGRAQRGLNVSAEDPIIKNQTDAYRAEQERAAKNYLSQAAEQGSSLENLSPEARSASEHVGQQSSAFQSQLMGRELQAQRKEIADALSGARGLLTAEQQMQLQEALHNIDNELQAWMFSTGQGAQESQFARSLAQREGEFGRNLGQQESQFGRNLGQRAYEYDTTRGDTLFG